MQLRLRINLVFAIVRTNGTKRFHFYHNEYGVEAGWNIIPRRFGIFAYVAKVA